MTAHYLIRQRITLGVNRYELWTSDASWAPVTELAFAQQKRMKLKEEVPFFADDSKQAVRFSLKARNVMDVASVVDVVDVDGSVIGSFSKDFKKSLLISTWYVDQPGLPRAIGQEVSQLYAIVRRIGFEFVPYDFLFTAEDTGQPVMSIVRKWGVRDAYRITVEDERYDARLLLAMATGLDFLQNR
ncbi:hypothetical protein QQX10_06530 [Demequina sp. SYSU T00039]|uniref:Acetyltransferase (GNAT) domain-containing protein n=1 Tax=Demequina lignilytica TaxID=3051663 RepID=A0AAW7M9B8_9MICO|nr:MULTISPECIES: hypothetical protein [unclassified Demequina]MDN4477912.1 hypothetical protein [Demequina sp. SYSU T00039-1]MDN4487821.1 hypothetical protein [Demequina sp. SYSU T00039]MDN4490796.1 hypothetical protein [Demequina sp. SYSU T00068]